MWVVLHTLPPKQFFKYLTIAIIINAVVGDLSSVHPHIGCQVWVVSLNARVNDADRHTGAAQGLLVPVTRRLHQIQVIQAVPIGCVSILDADLVVQRCICNICTKRAVSADILRPSCDGSQVLEAGPCGLTCMLITCLVLWVGDKRKSNTCCIRHTAL